MFYLLFSLPPPYLPSSTSSTSSSFFFFLLFPFLSLKVLPQPQRTPKPHRQFPSVYKHFPKPYLDRIFLRNSSSSLLLLLRSLLLGHFPVSFSSHFTIQRLFFPLPRMSVHHPLPPPLPPLSHPVSNSWYTFVVDFSFFHCPLNRFILSSVTVAFSFLHTDLSLTALSFTPLLSCNYSCYRSTYDYLPFPSPADPFKGIPFRSSHPTLQHLSPHLPSPLPSHDPLSTASPRTPAPRTGRPPTRQYSPFLSSLRMISSQAREMPILNAHFLRLLAPTPPPFPLPPHLCPRSLPAPDGDH